MIEVQKKASPSHLHEEASVYLSMILASPLTCLVAVLPDGKLVGYEVSHPHDSLTSPPPLNVPVSYYSDPSSSTSLFVHDVCVSPTYAGHGLGI